MKKQILIAAFCCSLVGVSAQEPAGASSTGTTVQAPPRPAPALSDETKDQIAVLVKVFLAAKREADAAQALIVAFTRGLQVPGYSLELQPPGYVKIPDPPPPPQKEP